MPAFDFGRRSIANDFRDRIPEHLAPADDRRSTTVKLESDTPDSIIQRARTAAQSSRESESAGAGMSELTPSERQTFERTHPSFEWQRHGFEAMRAKAALKARGVTEWQNFYEPGEPAESAIQKIENAKARQMETRAPTGLSQERRESRVSEGRRAVQAERTQAAGVERAKEPALAGADSDAIEFLEEERLFSDELFDISISQPPADVTGVPSASGTDVERLRDRHQRRSQRAQTVDEQSSAPITDDPLKWTRDPDEWDFPSVDTIDVERAHAARSGRARSADESELAPLADSPRQWAKNKDDFDIRGVDTPGSGGLIDDIDMDDDSLKMRRKIGGTKEFAAEFSRSPAGEPDVRERQRAQQELAERDIPASSEEVFEGVGAVGMTALGGFDPIREQEIDDPVSNVFRTSNAVVKKGLASDVEADLAFDRAEQERLHSDERLM